MGLQLQTLPYLKMLNQNHTWMLILQAVVGVHKTTVKGNTRAVQKVLSLTYLNKRETDENTFFNIFIAFVTVQLIAILDFFNTCKIENF